ncbi:MAG: nitrate oxidoreductase subunit beta [Chloroflexota bacterium]|nr:nitrate oxidoreductase subunit beta [Chloroflexota bacterium]
MPDVYNWQLGRPMTYRFREAHPKWQFAAVFNINRCIACQTCTMACKSTWTFSEGQEHMWWNNVETKPYGGYPHHWDVNTLKLLDKADPGGQKWDGRTATPAAPYGQFTGKTIFEAAAALGKTDEAIGYLPTDDEWTAPNIFEDTPRNRRESELQATSLPEHRTWFFYLQRICNHCTYPACLAACPRNAIYKRPEDGIVLIDEQRCRGYRKCVEQCPYKKPMFRSTTRVSEKCIACYPRIEGTDPISEGEPMETRCMSACVGKIRLQGLIEVGADGRWAVNPDNPLYYMVREEQVALPLYPQFGTEPNIYYIPPRWVPRPYLHQMFGPGADAAIERYAAPSRRLQAVLQLFRTTQRIVHRFEVVNGHKIGEMNVAGKTMELFNDTVVGFDRNGKEIVRQSVMEPLHDRGPKYLNTI